MHGGRKGSFSQPSTALRYLSPVHAAVLSRRRSGCCVYVRRVGAASVNHRPKPPTCSSSCSCSSGSFPILPYYWLLPSLVVGSRRLRWRGNTAAGALHADCRKWRVRYDRLYAHSTIAVVVNIGGLRVLYKWDSLRPFSELQPGHKVTHTHS